MESILNMGHQSIEIDTDRCKFLLFVEVLDYVVPCEAPVQDESMCAIL